MGSDVTFSQAQSVALPALPPHAPGVAGLLATLDAKRRSPSCCRHAGLLCAPFLGDARRDGEKVSPEVTLTIAGKAEAGQAGGWGQRPQSCVLAGPWPHGPETGRFQKRRQRGVFRASGDVFRGKLGHQEGFWHGVCFPYLDNLGLTFGCKSILNSRKPAVDAVLREILLCNEKSPISAVATQTEIGGFMLPHFANQRSQRRQRRQKQRRRNCRK